MAYPAGVITRPVSFGPAFELEDGDPVGMKVTFKATRPGVLWMATGQPAVSKELTKTSNDGVEESLPLPVTNQAGWGDGDGNAIVPGPDGHVFLYLVTITYTQGGFPMPGTTPRSKVVAIPEGDGTALDLDKLMSLTSPGGTLVSVPDIWSGLIDEAWAAATLAQAALVDSTEFVISTTADAVADPADPLGVTANMLEGLTTDGDPRKEAVEEIVTTKVEVATSGTIPSYNVKASSLRKFRSLMTKLRSGAATSDVKMLIIGDSTEWGVGDTSTTSPPTTSPSAKFSALFRSAYASAYVGLALPPYSGTSPTSDSRWTLGTGWTTSYLGFANDATFVGATGSAALTFKPGVTAGPVDTFDVYYIDNGVAAQITLALTGGSNVVVNSGGSPGIRKATVTTPKASNAHTLTITNTGAASIYVVGVEPYSSTSRRLRVANGAVGGTSLKGWVAAGQYAAGPSIAAYAANLTVISLGLNDLSNTGTGGVALSTAELKASFKTNLRALITTCRATGEVMLKSPSPMLIDSQAPKWAAIHEVYHELSTELDLPLFCNAERFGTYAEANALGMYSDTLHPNGLGQSYVADGYMQMFSSLLGDAPAQTDEIRIPAASMVAGGGTPSLTTILNFLPVWAFDSAADESVGAGFRIPTTWKKFDVVIRGASLFTGAALNVKFWGAYGQVPVGSNPGDVVDGGLTAVAFAVGAQYVIQETVLAANQTVKPGDNLTWVNVKRFGSDAADTYPQDYGVVELIVRRVA
jgi:lysophospholipase L1-like esterase